MANVPKRAVHLRRFLWHAEVADVRVRARPGAVVVDVERASIGIVQLSRLPAVHRHHVAGGALAGDRPRRTEVHQTEPVFHDAAGQIAMVRTVLACTADEEGQDLVADRIRDLRGSQRPVETARSCAWVSCDVAISSSEGIGSHLTALTVRGAARRPASERPSWQAEKSLASAPPLRPTLLMNGCSPCVSDISAAVRGGC